MTKSPTYSVREAAAVLGITPQRVFALLHAGKLAYTTTTQWGRIRYWVSRSAVKDRKKESDNARVA